MTPLFGPSTWWNLPGLWAAALLALLATGVPGRRGALDDEERRRLIRHLLRAGLVAWAGFLGWAVWRWFACMRDLRLLGPRAGPPDYALGLDIVGRVAFAGWASLGGAIVLAGIVDRQREARWKRCVLLVGFACIVTASIVLFPAQSYSVETQAWVRSRWEERLFPALGVTVLVSLVCVVAAAIEVRTARRSGNRILQEDRLRLLAGAGAVLSCAGVLFALERGFWACESIMMLGPRVTPRDIHYFLTRPFIFPGAITCLGLLAAAFGLVHLRPRRKVDGG